jgi:16S rRNA (cytidine1402-2'-O)-methyltransferase
MLKEISEQKMTSVIFESPHRIERTFQDLATLLAPERRICICRELTKKFEEIICDSISNIEFDKIKPLGEFVIVIEGIK